MFNYYVLHAKNNDFKAEMCICVSILCTIRTEMMI